MSLEAVAVKHSARVLRLELGLLNKVCEQMNTPVSLGVYLRAKYGEWQQLLDMDVNPLDYCDHNRFGDDYLCVSLLSKNPRLPTGIDRKAVALEKFIDAERLNSLTNKRLSEFLYDGISPSDWVTRVVHTTRAHVFRILGKLRRRELDFVEQHMRFGPGATTTLSGVVTQGKKYSPRTLGATPRVADYILCFPPQWAAQKPDVVIHRASKLTTVPKNAKTDRVICIEPDLNIYVQLGIGACIREKLRVCGLDLNTQENNQRAASVAHLKGLCTMDLSSASDLISYMAVRLLVPDDWQELLAFARVDYTTMPDGTTVALEKWSSMGNGYTFELETLLFYCVLLAVRDVDGGHETTDEFLAYGDDLIFPSRYYDSVKRTLDFLGFKVNTKKTFGKGLFFESCGSDWFNGRNVRPIFLRSESHDYQTVCYTYANGLRRWANRRNGGWSCDSRILPAWLCCFRAVSRHDQYLIPEGAGDVGFAADFDFAKPGYRAGLYTFRCRALRPQQCVVNVEGAYLHSLVSRTDFSQGREALRGRFVPPARARGHVLAWPNLGPWL